MKEGVVLLIVGLMLGFMIGLIVVATGTVTIEGVPCQ